MNFHIWLLLKKGYAAKKYIRTIDRHLLNSHNKAIRHIIILILELKELRFKGLTNMLKITWPVEGRGRIWTSLFLLGPRGLTLTCHTLLLPVYPYGPDQDSDLLTEVCLFILWKPKWPKTKHKPNKSVTGSQTTCTGRDAARNKPEQSWGTAPVAKRSFLHKVCVPAEEFRTGSQGGSNPFWICCFWDWDRRCRD